MELSPGLQESIIIKFSRILWAGELEIKHSRRTYAMEIGKDYTNQSSYFQRTGCYIFFFLTSTILNIPHQWAKDMQMIFRELPPYSITLWNVGALGNVERWISTMVLVQHPLSRTAVSCREERSTESSCLRTLALFLLTVWSRASYRGLYFVFLSCKLGTMWLSRFEKIIFEGTSNNVTEQS